GGGGPRHLPELALPPLGGGPVALATRVGGRRDDGQRLPRLPRRARRRRLGGGRGRAAGGPPGIGAGGRRCGGPSVSEDEAAGPTRDVAARPRRLVSSATEGCGETRGRGCRGRARRRRLRRARLVAARLPTAITADRDRLRPRSGALVRPDAGGG